MLLSPTQKLQSHFRQHSLGQFKANARMQVIGNQGQQKSAAEGHYKESVQNLTVHARTCWPIPHSARSRPLRPHPNKDSPGCRPVPSRSWRLRSCTFKLGLVRAFKRHMSRSALTVSPVCDKTCPCVKLCPLQEKRPSTTCCQHWRGLENIREPDGKSRRSQSCKKFQGSYPR